MAVRVKRGAVSSFFKFPLGQFIKRKLGRGLSERPHVGCEYISSLCNRARRLQPSMQQIKGHAAGWAQKPSYHQRQNATPLLIDEATASQPLR
jgi:hypothetical protein